MQSRKKITVHHENENLSIVIELLKEFLRGASFGIIEISRVKSGPVPAQL